MLGSLCVLLFVAAVIRNGESIVNDTETVNAKGGSSAGLQCSRGACFPLYYILGAPKAGSSSLWELFNALYKKQPRMSRRLAAHDGTTRSPILKHRAKRDVRRDPDAANLLKKTVSQVQRSEKQMSGRPAVGKQNRSVQSILPVVHRYTCVHSLIKPLLTLNQASDMHRQKGDAVLV